MTELDMILNKIYLHIYEYVYKILFFHSSFFTLPARDGKSPHGDGYPWGFSPFGEGMRIISYPISYSGRGRG